MLLNIITGAPGSGKSTKLYELMRQNLKNNPDCKAILIVPEQFSYNAEKTLADEMGGLGLNNIEVLTFSRLTHRFLDNSKNILPSGKIMLICKAAASAGETNSFYKSTKKPGFLASLGELFSEFKRYMITPEDLDSLSLDAPGVQKKIASVSEIYTEYLSLFGDEFTDSDDALEAFAATAEASELFSDTFFFIDDYNDLLPQHYAAVSALIRTSRGVHITLGAEGDDEDGMFASVIKTKKTLFAIAKKADAQIYSTALPCNYHKINSPEIRFLAEHFESQKIYENPCEAIELFTARDLYSEVERTASKIISAVRDNNMRFRDIGIICGDMEQYLHILNAVFKDYNIPFFTDEKLAVTLHPVAKTVLSLFEIISENWSYNSVFDYLRSGCVYTKNEDGEIAPFNPEGIDLLENYVLLHGIKGKKMWFCEWTKSGETIFDDVIENRNRTEYDLNYLNALRREIIAPFEAFLENRGRTAQAIAAAVYDFMCAINLYEGILSDCEQFDLLGMRDESEQYRQVWNALLEVLDQLVLVIGKGAVSRESFFEYFKNGLSQCRLSIIPSGLDRVSVGTVERNTPQNVKIMFIIGAAYGSIPAVASSGSLLSDSDRIRLISALSEKEKELAPDNLNRALRENLKLYRIFASTGKKLYISFPAADSEGRAIAPAAFISALKKMFPQIKTYDNIISKPSNEELLASSKRGFYYMLAKLSEYYSEKPEQLWQSVFDWYSKNDEYKDKLEILRIAAKYKKAQPHLSRAKAMLLYGKNKKYSITALEKFSKCPFSYYAERGLYAKPQEIKRVEKSHIGSLIHAAVCEFCKLVEKGSENLAEIHTAWQELTPEKSAQLVREVMAKMSEKILLKTGDEKKQIEYLLSRCERTLAKSVETIRKSLASGEYTSVCYEKNFEVTIDWKADSITLLGTIDRIDIMQDIAKNKTNIRIVDYKSGHKKFSVAAISNKLDMQLVLYAVAAVKMYENSNTKAQVSAVLYNRLNDDFVTSDNPELAKKELQKQQKLDGLVILDEDAETRELIHDTILDMDSTFSENRSSEFLNVSLKKDDTFTSSSQVMSRKDFDVMSDYIKKAAVDFDKSIKSGNISINPCRDGTFSACNYCDFKEMCMFDTAFDKYRRLETDTQRAIENMKKEVSEDE